MEQERKYHRQWLTAIILTLALFMLGMFVGWSSPSLRTLKRPDSEVYLSEDQISWMVSLVYIGSTLSPVPTGWLMNILGRRLTLMVLTSTALASWIILAIIKNPVGVYASRFLGGMWCGSAYTVVPVYLCEVAEPEVRGALNTLFMLIVYIGIMFEYCIGPQVSYTALSYISACVPVTFFVLLLLVPESPYFYLMKGDRISAGKALAWLRCIDTIEVEKDLAVIEQAVKSDMENKGTFKDLVSTAGNRKALLIAVTLAVLQRMSGISVVMAYASAAIPHVGMLTPNDCAVILCIVWIVFGFVSTIVVNWVGRRYLLAISCVGTAIGNAMVTTWFYLDAETGVDAMKFAWFPLLSFVVFGVFYPVGLGSIPSMIQGEMFPSNTRGLASGVTSTAISCASFITNKMYYNIGDMVGIYLNYAIFFVSCVYGIYFSLAVVIETKDRTLEDIQKELAEYTTSRTTKKENKNCASSSLEPTKLRPG